MLLRSADDLKYEHESTRTKCPFPFTQKNWIDYLTVRKIT